MNLTLTGLCEQLGVSKAELGRKVFQHLGRRRTADDEVLAVIAHWEEGTRPPSSDEVQAMSEILEVPINVIRDVLPKGKFPLFELEMKVSKDDLKHLLSVVESSGQPMMLGDLIFELLARRRTTT